MMLQSKVLDNYSVHFEPAKRQLSLDFLDLLGFMRKARWNDGLSSGDS